IVAILEGDEIIGEAVTADALLGQIEQDIAHIQQADAEVRVMLGAARIARAQTIAAQHPHGHTQPPRGAVGALHALLRLKMKLLHTTPFTRYRLDYTTSISQRQ